MRRTGERDRKCYTFQRERERKQQHVHGVFSFSAGTGRRQELTESIVECEIMRNANSVQSLISMEGNNQDCPLPFNIVRFIVTAKLYFHQI